MMVTERMSWFIGIGAVLAISVLAIMLPMPISGIVAFGIGAVALVVNIRIATRRNQRAIDALDAICASGVPRQKDN